MRATPADREAIPPHLNPRLRFGRWEFDCPLCGHPKRAWSKGAWWKCNREGSCSGEGSTADLWEGSNNAPRRRSAPDRDEKKRTQLESGELQKALYKLGAGADAWLRSRLPGIDIEILRRRGLVGNPRDLPLKWAFHRQRQGWELFCPLFSVDNAGRICSGQVRWTRKKEPPEKRQKSLTLPGHPYGEFGATFGRLDQAINAAGVAGELLVVEGMPDFLTIAGMGKRNAVGIPGAASATLIARYLAKHGWEGRLTLCLDPDNAGEKYTHKAAAEFAGVDTVEVAAVRWPKAQDLNDVYRDKGSGAVNFHLAAATVIKSARAANPADKRRWEREEKKRELQELGLWVWPRYPTKGARDRMAAVAIAAAKKSPVRRVMRVAQCCVFREAELAYDENRQAALKRVRTRIAESPGCHHCASAAWNRVVAPHLLKEWPSQLLVGTARFPRGDLARANELRSLGVELTRGDDGTKSFATFVDPERSRVVFILGPETQHTGAMARIRALANFKLTSRKVTLRTFIKPAYLGWAEYVLNVCQDENRDPSKDPFIGKQFKRYMAREGLPMPGDTRCREMMRGDKDPEPEEPEVPLGIISLFVTYNRFDRRALAITLRPLAFKNVVRAVSLEHMQFKPLEEGNLLDRPDLSPIPIEDVLEDLARLEGSRLDEPEQINCEDWRLGANDDELWARARATQSDQEWVEIMREVSGREPDT